MKRLKLVNESLYGFKDQIHSSVQSESDDNEGAHYKVKLEEIVNMSKDLYSKLPEGRIPAWVGDKIVVAKEYLYSVTSWLHGIEEKIEGETFGANREMDYKEDHNMYNDDFKSSAQLTLNVIEDDIEPFEKEFDIIPFRKNNY